MAEAGHDLGAPHFPPFFALSPAACPTPTQRLRFGHTTLDIWTFLPPTYSGAWTDHVVPTPRRSGPSRPSPSLLPTGAGVSGLRETVSCSSRRQLLFSSRPVLTAATLAYGESFLGLLFRHWEWLMSGALCQAGKDVWSL